MNINCEECGAIIYDRSEAYESPWGEPICWDCYYHDELYKFEDEPYEEFEDDE